MITLKSKREIQGMQTAGDILAGLFIELEDYIKPGQSTFDIDEFSYKYIVGHGATPGELNFEGYKYSTCISVNDMICHGCPSKNIFIKEGDLIKVDTVIDYEGYLSDACHAFVVGKASDEVQQLMDVTLKSLYLGIDQAIIGNRIGDIGFAIQEYAEDKGYGVVRDYVGHGIGPTMHEAPDVPHYGRPGHGTRLKAGMTITIEPMINVGSFECSEPDEDDGWTIRTVDGSLSCQYEHTIVITNDGPKILTSCDHEMDAKYLL